MTMSNCVVVAVAVVNVVTGTASEPETFCISVEVVVVVDMSEATLVADGIEDLDFNPAQVGNYLKAEEVNKMIDDEDPIFEPD